MITNDGILSSDNQVEFGEGDGEENVRFFDAKRYYSAHGVAFFACSFIILSIVVF
jgi:hypothetical protein